MPEGSLYQRGWRQGSIFEGVLLLHATVVNANGAPEGISVEHNLWVVATQDCDLDFADARANDPVIELRAVYTDDPPDNWGIRSHFLKLDAARYVLANKPRCHVSPAILSLFESARNASIGDVRTRAFKTWLGLRYDRPAIPDPLLALGKRISDEVERKRRRPMGERVRDVLIQFDEGVSPPHYSLYAVIDDEGDEEEVRAWLADIALSVPQELGIGDEFEAPTADRTSLTLIETSYPANVSQLTWGGATPEKDS